MNKIEKIFKDRFQNKASTEGIDTDNLWAAIEGDLAGNVKKGVFYEYRKWALLLLIGLFSSALYLYTSTDNSYNENALAESTDTITSEGQENESSPTNKVAKTDHSITVDHLAQKSAPTGKEPAEQMSLPTKKINLPFEKDNEAGLLSLLQAREEAFKLNLSQAGVSRLRTQNPITYQPNYKTIKRQPQLLPQLPFVRQNKPLSFQAPSSGLPTEKLSRTSRQTEQMPTLSMSVVMATKNNTPEWLKTKARTLVPKRKSNNLPLEFGLYTGVNTVATRYENTGGNSTLSENLAAATSQNMGVSSSLRISYLLGDHYTVNSGIDYEVTQNIFEKVVLKDTVILDPNRLIDYEIDPQTGDTTNAVYGEVLLDAIETRTVLHHNRFKVISIPISFGMRKQFGQFGIGVNLGVSYNFFISQKGKTLDDQGNIYAFDENGTAAAPFKKSFFAFQLNPYFDIAVSDHVRLRINPVFKYQMQGQSNLYGIGQNSILMGLSGGVVFSL